MTDETLERIDAIVKAHPIVLFLKGTRQSPQCGFSARVVDVLDEWAEDYEAIDALSDEALREGIKRYSSWPTLPQLYVGGRLVGGADIVSELVESGEIGQTLGLSAPLPTPKPEVTVSDAAVAAFRRFADEDHPSVRLVIDRGFEPMLDIAPPERGDILLELGTITLALDKASARRADGLAIDFMEGPKAAGFKLENPNAPAKVKSLDVEELDRWRREGKPHLHLDVRTMGEWTTAHIEGARLVDDEVREELDTLDRSTALVFSCHHGVRSRAAAEHAVKLGFRDVFNLEGGIEAWSERVDPRVPRY